MSPPSVRSRVVRGLGAMAVLQLLGASANFLTLIVLARLLSPFDFGIVAIASLITGLVGTFGDFGLGAAVVQRQDRVEDALYTANTIRWAISIGLFVVTLFIAPLVAEFFSASEATTATRVVALLFFLNSASFIPLTRLTKELKFGIILRASATAAVVSAVTSVTLAYAGFGYWTIIIASIVAAVVSLTVFRLLAPWRLHMRYDRKLAKELLQYGKHLFLMNIFVFLIFNLDNAAVAYGMGTIALGYYALAFKWANIPVNFLSKVAAQVMMPAYVMLRDSAERLRKGYLETILMINSVSLPAYVGLLLLADDFVVLVLGPTWIPIATPLRVLCAMGILRGVAEPGSYLFMATGQSKLVSINTGCHLAALLVLLYPGLVFGGLGGVALAVVVSYAVDTVLIFRSVARLVAIPLGTILQTLRGVVLASGALALAVGSLSLALETSFLSFVATVGIGLGAYLLVLHSFEPGMLRRYFRQLLEAVHGS